MVIVVELAGWWVTGACGRGVSRTGSSEAAGGDGDGGGGRQREGVHVFGDVGPCVCVFWWVVVVWVSSVDRGWARDMHIREY